MQRAYRIRERPPTVVRALKAGSWEAAMAQQLDGELLPEDCPYAGASSRRVWGELRELQLAYQNREPGWERLPAGSSGWPGRWRAWRRWAPSADPGAPEWNPGG